MPQSAEAGADIIINIWDEDATPAAYISVAGQQGLSVDEGVKAIAVTSKEDGDDTFIISKHGNWKIDLDAGVILSDAGYILAMAKFRTKELAKVEIVYPDQTAREGYAIITNCVLAGPDGEAATLKLSLQGTGSLTDVA